MKYVKIVDTVQHGKSELDIYLEEGVFICEDSSSAFNALEWWKSNSSKFRVLSKMACEVLSISITMMASKSTFSAGEKYGKSPLELQVHALQKPEDQIPNPPELDPPYFNGRFDFKFDNVGRIETVGPKYAEIIVIRHGKTEWNADHRIQGQLDVDLNDLGRRQAFAVAERLSWEPKISAVYSSDLKRAFDTAEIIARSCGVIEVIKDRDLRERHLGDLQGVRFHEAAQIKPAAHKAFVSLLGDLEIPGGGESFSQLYDRGTSALQRIAKKHKGERVVVVSHGATIEALLARASPSEDFKGKILNACVNIFHLSENHEDECWSVKSWGDVSHLKTPTL